MQQSHPRRIAHWASVVRDSIQAVSKQLQAASRLSKAWVAVELELQLQPRQFLIYMYPQARAQIIRMTAVYIDK